MISKLLYTIQGALSYSSKHPQILFVLTLLFLLPLLFLYSGQQFLDAGRTNQDSVQKSRIGIMHDAFVSLVQTNAEAPAVLQTEIERIQSTNPDIVSFTITRLQSGELKMLASSDSEQVGETTEYTDLYRSAAVRSDESIIFEIFTNDGRQWLAFRSIEVAPGQFYFIQTETTLAATDAVFAAREQTALYSLLIIYAFIIALAYWHVRLTDYRYLYLKVREANEMKDLFTNMIAHELRTPLTAIQGYASLLEDRLQDNDKREQAMRIRQSANRLLAIVNDLLDVARIQSGKLSMNVELTDVSKVLNRVVGELQPLAQKQRIPLYYQGTDVVHLIKADAMRLEQAIINVVSNALKYTKEGKIEIDVSENVQTIEIRVKDTGMGISAKDQKELFAPFFRVTRTDVSKITGTGLGMWISKHLVELMGGTIEVESIKGVGTHVVIAFAKATGDVT